MLPPFQTEPVIVLRTLYFRVSWADNRAVRPHSNVLRQLGGGCSDPKCDLLTASVGPRRLENLPSLDPQKAQSLVPTTSHE